jgi:hypothetical protein
MKKIYKVFQILALVSSAGASFTSATMNNSTAAVAWGCCVCWILNLMMTERVLEKANALLEQMKKQNNE